jgi:hypothetical protein
MFFIHRVLNAVTMMYNEAEELTACHFIRPSTYFKQSTSLPEEREPLRQDAPASASDEETDPDMVDETPIERTNSPK